MAGIGFLATKAVAPPLGDRALCAKVAEFGVISYPSFLMIVDIKGSEIE